MFLLRSSRKAQWAQQKVHEESSGMLVTFLFLATSFSFLRGGGKGIKSTFPTKMKIKLSQVIEDNISFTYYEHIWD